MTRLINGLPEKEWRKQWWAKYHVANTDRITKRQREYYARNRDKQLENRRRYVEENRERVRELGREHYRRNRDQRLAENRNRKYNITQQEVEAMLLDQGHRCAICLAITAGGKGNWHVDHDHRSGRVRGLLCDACNVSLGHMRDDPIRLRKAADYIEKGRG